MIFGIRNMGLDSMGTSLRCLRKKKKGCKELDPRRDPKDKPDNKPDDNPDDKRQEQVHNRHSSHNRSPPQEKTPMKHRPVKTIVLARTNTAILITNSPSGPPQS